MDDERAGEGVEHLQAAAHELIAAARAFLDVAEDLVRDPQVAEGLVVGLGDLAQTVRTAARDAAGRAADGGGSRPGTDGDGGDGGVQHIPVS